MGISVKYCCCSCVMGEREGGTTQRLGAILGNRSKKLGTLA